MALRALSFDVKFSWVGAGPQSGEACGYWAAHVEPLIDGARLRPVKPKRRAVFGCVDALARGDESGRLDIFNCSCGTPECVGIDHQCALEAGEDTVRWIFPSDPYRRWLSKRNFPKASPLELVFDRAQYLEALKGLAAAIDAKKALGKPVAIGEMESPGEECLTLSVADFLKACAESSARHARWRMESEQAIGAMDGWEVVALLPDGSEHAAVLAEIASALSQEPGEKAGWDERHRRVELMREALLADPAGAAARMSPEQVDQAFAPICEAGGAAAEDDSDDDLEYEAKRDRDRDRIAKQWGAAMFKVVRRHPGIHGGAKRLPTA